MGTRVHVAIGAIAYWAAHLFVLLLAGTAEAAVPLSVDLAATSFPNRSEGPIPVTLRLRWSGPGVFDGQLLLSIVDGYEGTLCRVATDPLYLTEGEHEYSLLLPSFHATGQLGELQLRITSVVGEERTVLPPLLLRVPKEEQRRLAILVSGDGSLQSPRVGRFVDSLKLEPFDPGPQPGCLTTVSQFLAPDQFPEDPLLFCPFDLVVVPPGEWERLRPKALDALTAWTCAGGSLLLVPDEKPAKPQLEFLERLVGVSDRPEITFGVDTDGNLVLPEREETLLLRTDLGRLVVISADAMGTAARSDPAWRRAIAFLWKLQHAHLESFVTSGVWDINVAKQVAEEQGIGRRWNAGQLRDDATLETMASRLEPHAVSGGSGMLRLMMPAGLRLVPFALMIFLLLLYVAAIGPFDYWFLGLLRQRKLTWVLFPAVTFGFTAFAVWISNVFMAATDHRGNVVFRDVGGDGRLLKESRFELLFPGRSTTMTTELRRALYMPVNHDEFIAADWQYNPYDPSRQNQGGRSGPPLISGRPPQRMTIIQQIAQWTPQLNRTVSIPLAETDDDTEEAAPQEFDWSEPIDWSSAADVRSTLARIQQAFGRDAAAYLYHEQTGRALIGPDNFFADEMQPGREVLNASGVWIWTPIDFLKDLCVRRQPGWFGVVSQSSPGCGAAMEDLAILDASDPDMWLLVIAVEEADDTVLYRKVYRQETGE